MSLPLCFWNFHFQTAGLHQYVYLYVMKIRQFTMLWLVAYWSEKIYSQNLLLCICPEWEITHIFFQSKNPPHYRSEKKVPLSLSLDENQLGLDLLVCLSLKQVFKAILPPLKNTRFMIAWLLDMYHNFHTCPHHHMVRLNFFLCSQHNFLNCTYCKFNYYNYQNLALSMETNTHCLHY